MSSDKNMFYPYVKYIIYINIYVIKKKKYKSDRPLQN